MLLIVKDFERVANRSSSLGHAKGIIVTRLSLSLICMLGIASTVQCQEQAHQGEYTDRSFIFIWPGQPESDARLNLLDPIVTDRPDFTEASSTVGNGVIQAEMGYTFFYNDGGAGASESSHVYPELLLRFGVISDWIEFRFGQTLISLLEPEQSSTGFGDTYLGVKFGIVPQLGILPELSIVPQLTVPSGSADLRADRVLYGVNVLYSWSILNDSYLGASTQFNQRQADDPDQVFTSFAQALVGGTRWDDAWGSYIEWFALFADSSCGDEDSHFANGGMTYLVTNNLQLDVRLGTRLQGRIGEEIFAGFGLSVRYF